MKIEFNLNDKSIDLDVRPYESLLKVLRERLQTRSVKQGCDYGGCGACTAIIDGKAFYSCMVPAIRVQGKKVLTIEGLVREGGRRLDPIQEEFRNSWAVQCGFCSSGMILSAKALLDSSDSKPTETEIREAVVGNLCVCTGYQKIIEAIQQAAEKQFRKNR